MKLLDKIYSKLDKTIKYVFQLWDGLISEVSYIDKDDGKDIICVSTHTACKLACKFCYMTDCIGKITMRYISAEEICEQIEYIRNDLGLKEKILLISYMGCGEPLLNPELVGSMLRIKSKLHSRFGLATLIPSWGWDKFFELTKNVKLYQLPLKVHLSLHFIDDVVRKEWMPSALEVKVSIAALEFYKGITGNSVEIHYALIDGVNDSKETARSLSDLLWDRDIPVKLLKYNERPAAGCKASDNVKMFMHILQSEGIQTEYYEPPGVSIGASCGQFLMDYYHKYNFIDPIDK